MDLLKAELERKRKAIAASAATNNNINNNKNSGGEKTTTRRYLTASERRQRLEEEDDERRCEGKNGKGRREEGEEEEEEELRRKKKKNKKRRRRGHGDDDDDDDEEEEEEDLTTMITRRYDPSSSRGAGRGDSIEGTVKAGERSSSSSSSGAAASSSSSSSSIGKNEDNDDRKRGGSSSRDGASSSSSVVDNVHLPPADATNALRRFGLPVRLFGEDENARLKRLSIAMIGRENDALGECERDEFLLDRTSRTRNVFLEREDDNEQQGDGGGGDVVGGEGGKGRSSGGGGGGGNRRDGANVASSSARTSVVPLTEEELNDRPKRIYRYFKSLLRQWEEDLSRRPDSVKRTAAGKNETKTLKQCKDYIRPLFQLCKRRELEEGLQSHLFDIVVHCEMGEFVRAHDAYMDVAIGRAAWPIGVTMVGIHARSGRAKIESSNVAHMMNSEVNRKYLTSVKRLMSYAQKKRPDVHPSKKVMNV